jgi:hypothetical protein
MAWGVVGWPRRTAKRVADRIVGVKLGVFGVLAVRVLPEDVGTSGFRCCGVFGLWITLPNW